MKTRTHFAHRIEMLDAAGAEKPGRSKWGVLCPSPAQANIAQSTDSAASKARSSALASIPAPHSKGAATKLPPRARVDGLGPRMRLASPRLMAGHLSGNDRATRCPTGRSPPRADAPSRPRPVGAVNGWCKIANLRRANNLDMTIVEITRGMLRAARSLTGLSQQELAHRACISRPCLTAWEGSSGSVPNAGVRALSSSNYPQSA